MRNTKTTNKKTGAIRPANQPTTGFIKPHTSTNAKKGLIDIMIDVDEMLSKRSLAEIRARKKLAADFARFKSETNTRLTALEAVS